MNIGSHRLMWYPVSLHYNHYISILLAACCKGWEITSMLLLFTKKQSPFQIFTCSSIKWKRFPIIEASLILWSWSQYTVRENSGREKSHNRISCWIFTCYRLGVEYSINLIFFAVIFSFLHFYVQYVSFNMMRMWGTYAISSKMPWGNKHYSVLYRITFPFSFPVQLRVVNVLSLKHFPRTQVAGFFVAGGHGK